MHVFSPFQPFCLKCICNICVNSYFTSDILMSYVIKSYFQAASSPKIHFCYFHFGHVSFVLCFREKINKRFIFVVFVILLLHKSIQLFHGLIGLNYLAIDFVIIASVSTYSNTKVLCHLEFFQNFIF